MQSVASAAGGGNGPPKAAYRDHADRIKAAEVAAILGCSAQTVYKAAERGTIPAHRWAGTRSWWFSRREIEAHVAKQGDTRFEAPPAGDAPEPTPFGQALADDLSEAALLLSNLAIRISQRIRRGVQP